jgi:Domain of unknown function (DUF4160)
LVTIARVGALRLIIFADDHEPPHVHIMGDGETKIVLGDSPQAIKVIFSINTKANERRRAVAAVRDHHALLLRRWSELHG